MTRHWRLATAVLSTAALLALSRTSPAKVGAVEVREQSTIRYIRVGYTEPDVDAIRMAALSSEVARLRSQLARRTTTPSPAVAPVVQPVQPPTSILTAIEDCESGKLNPDGTAIPGSRNYAAVNPSSGAGGVAQIMPSTFAYLGYSGLPEYASEATQQEAAQKLYALDGTRPWESSASCWRR